MSSTKRSKGGGIFATGSVSGVTGGGPDLLNNIKNYNTFLATDRSVRSLMQTSDEIERTRRTVAESEDLAKNVLVDLELQRSQFHDMKETVAETSNITGQVRHLLHIIANRSYRKKICLYLVIIALGITDILVFYLLFVR